MADVVIMGSPVYFSYPTGEFRSFYERFLFPKYSYVVDAPLRNPKNVACIFTMNCPKHYFEHTNYPILLGENGRDTRIVYDFGENLYIYNTYQFDDYSEMAFTLFTEEEQREYKDTHFAEELHRAKERGIALMNDAKLRNYQKKENCIGFLALLIFQYIF